MSDGEDGEGGRSRWAALAESVGGVLNRIGGAAMDAQSQSAPAFERASAGLRTRRFKVVMVLLAVLTGAVAVEYYMVTRWFGAVNAILYTFGFLMAMAAVPLLVLFLGSATPGSGTLGKLHMVLAHVAYRYPYLLDRGDKYEYAPGTENAVWIDGEYHDIESGQDNRTVLGWRPFGIVLDKTTVDLVDKRADTKAEKERGHSADGGSIQRGGYESVQEPAVSGIDGQWVIDLKRVFSRGVKRIADIDIIETTEEVTQRNQSQVGKFSRWRSEITFLVSLVLGAGMAYIMLGG